MGRHPWSLTLRQLLDRIERDYAGEISSFFVLGSRGSARITILRRKVSSVGLATILDIDPDEDLTPTVLRSLCIQLGVPPEDFGLGHEDPNQDASE